MADQEIGKVIHYFDKAMVAVIRLTADLKIGDMVKIARNENEFTMSVNSMQVDHKPIEAGKAGDEVAIKTTDATKEGAVVYKVVEE